MEASVCLFPLLVECPIRFPAVLFRGGLHASADQMGGSRPVGTFVCSHSDGSHDARPHYARWKKT